MLAEVGNSEGEMPFGCLDPFLYVRKRVASLLHILLRHAEYEGIAYCTAREHDAIEAIFIYHLYRVFGCEDVA